jgi:hypothetical protein
MLFLEEQQQSGNAEHCCSSYIIKKGKNGV